MNGKNAKIPVYDFKTNARVPGKFTMIYSSDVVIVEGILVFYFPGIRDKFNLKLFVDTDADTILARLVSNLLSRSRRVHFKLKWPLPRT